MRKRSPKWFDAKAPRSGTARAVVLALMAALPSMGCAELPASARQQLIQAEVQYRDQDYQAALATLDAFLAEHPRHAESAEAYYLRALCHTQRSNKAQASADAQRCISLSKNKELSAKAHAMVGSLLFESGKLSAAKSHYAQALKTLPERPPTDLVRYRYGICLQRTGEWKQARLEFAAVFQRYPDSVLAQHARRMYDWPDDYYTIQCGAFRDKTGAYKLVKQLKATGHGSVGFNARLEPSSRSGQLLHVVYVGRYPLYAQAQEALRSVRRQVPDALVVP